MANYDGLTPGQVLADASVAEFIKELGLGIAEAQAALDRNSIEQIAILSQTTPSFSGKSLIELGLTPPFYHYQYADLEVSLSLSLKVQKDFGVNLGFNIGSSNQEQQSSSSGSTGQLGIEVRFGGGEPAKGVIELVSATAGTVVTGNTTTTLVTGSPSAATDVAIVPNRIRDTAYALADELRGNDVPEIDRVSVEIVSGPTPVNPNTDLAAVFVCAPNRVVVKGTQTTPAWALLALTVNDITGVVINGGTPLVIGPAASLEVATTTIATAIDGQSDVTAEVLVNEGRVTVTPLFDHDRDELLPAALDGLRRVARMLQTNSAWTLRLDGHTDLTGSTSYNDDLSQRRANRVRDFLLAQGVQGSQLSTQALGETQPAASGSGPVAANRRVELHLTAGPAHLIEIVGGPLVTTWGTMSVTPNASGSFVATQNSTALVAATGHYVEINNGTITTRLFLTLGASGAHQFDYTATSAAEADVATALAAAITTHVTDVEAWAVGNVVQILPPDSLARLSLYTTVRGNAANLLPLTTTGSLSRISAFAGGLDPAEPADGNTVSVGSTQLLVRASGANFANHEFNKGVDAAATATNLATAISSISGFSAAAAGAVVTITGASGTTVATNNANAFMLSASRIPGLAQFESEERTRAMAWGGSIGVRYSRQFGMEVTGNSSIRARLVAVPAPVELLDEIRDYLGSVE
jgi:outer membrane protein OmpA-like peptidoglycan-associated protein